jgi:cephalosporin hydroxylase
MKRVQRLLRWLRLRPDFRRSLLGPEGASLGPTNRGRRDSIAPQVVMNQTHQVVHLPDEIVSLASRYASSMMSAQELTYLAAALALAPWDRQGIVVEIGTYIGQTAAFMAKVLRHLGHRVPVLSIDPFERFQPDSLNPQGSYSSYINTILSHDVADVCLVLVAFSEQAAPVVPDRIGVLVVDGSHHYPDVRKDLELYAPKVLPGGIVFVDDYGGAYPDVRRAVDEYFTPDRPFTILHRALHNFLIAQRQ